ncbi:vitronectin [Lates japonicus]|uniref:Vitronectin n=1 Tax=Lates japonicus TaxID=270547 RepID=A0AAD3MLP7_LATJO|nr:vitronectin [Lates japonicus]
MTILEISSVGFDQLLITWMQHLPPCPWSPRKKVYFSSIDKHHFINKDGRASESPVNAAAAGRIYVTSRRLRPPPARRAATTGSTSSGVGSGVNSGAKQIWTVRRQTAKPFWGSMASRG